MINSRRAADNERQTFLELMREVEARANELEKFAGRNLTAADRADLLEFIRANVSGGTRADAIGWARREFIGGRAA